MQRIFWVSSTESAKIAELQSKTQVWINWERYFNPSLKGFRLIYRKTYIIHILIWEIRRPQRAIPTEKYWPQKVIKATFTKKNELKTPWVNPRGNKVLLYSRVFRLNYGQLFKFRVSSWLNSTQRKIVVRVSWKWLRSDYSSYLKQAFFDYNQESLTTSPLKQFLRQSMLDWE